MISTIASTAVVVLAIFALLLFAATYGELSNRVDKLADSQISLSESQALLSESQSQLSESQSLLSSAVQDVIVEVNSLSDSHNQSLAEVQRLSKAVHQQTIMTLKYQLILTCGGDRTVARERYELEKTANPGRDENWYFKQAIASATKPTSSST